MPLPEAHPFLTTLQLVEYDLDDLGQMTVQGETGHLYRYLDMTAQAEALYD